MKNILEIKNLTKYYGKTLAVKDLSLELHAGEIFGFIGPNGAGKSTTIRSIMNLINKTKGTVLIDGKEFDRNDTTTKEKIGYLPSEIFLYDDLTVKQMLDYHESFYKKDTSKRRKELVKLFELDEIVTAVLPSVIAAIPAAVSAKPKIYPPWALPKWLVLVFVIVPSNSQ